MNKTLFIINPIAGKGRSKSLIPQITSICDDAPDHFSSIITNKAHHATEITSSLNGEFTNLISVGGDGTLNEILNGIKEDKQINIGVLPYGSGNDFVKNFDNYSKVKELTNSLVQNNFKLKELYTGEIEYKNDDSDDLHKHRFINSIGIGFDAYVGYLNQKNKTFSGLTSYIFAVFKALNKLEYLKTDIIIDDCERISSRNVLITVGNGKSSGGGFYFTPKAEIDSELLDLATVEDLSRIKLLMKIPYALFNKVETVKELQMFKFRTVDITVDKPYYMHADGEIISKNAISVKVKSIKSPIKIITK